MILLLRMIEGDLEDVGAISTALEMFGYQVTIQGKEISVRLKEGGRMDLEEVKLMKDKLEKDLQQEIEQFEKRAGMEVLSVWVSRRIISMGKNSIERVRVTLTV